MDATPSFKKLVSSRQWSGWTISSVGSATRLSSYYPFPKKSAIVRTVSQRARSYIEPSCDTQLLSGFWRGVTAKGSANPSSDEWVEASVSVLLAKAESAIDLERGNNSSPKHRVECNTDALGNIAVYGQFDSWGSPVVAAGVGGHCCLYICGYLNVTCWVDELCAMPNCKRSEGNGVKGLFQEQWTGFLLFGQI